MRGDSRMLRRLTLLLAVAVPFGAAVPVARAGTYDVYSCWAGWDSFRNPSENASAWVTMVVRSSSFGRQPINARARSDAATMAAESPGRRGAMST